MIVAVFPVIGNSVRLSIFSRRDTINVMKLIGATDGFILRPFLNGGAMLGFAGALLSLVLSGALVWQLESVVAGVAKVFGTTFTLHGLGWDEALLLLIISAMIGWIAAAGDSATFTPIYTTVRFLVYSSPAAFDRVAGEVTSTKSAPHLSS